MRKQHIKDRNVLQIIFIKIAISTEASNFKLFCVLPSHCFTLLLVPFIILCRFLLIIASYLMKSMDHGPLVIKLNISNLKLIYVALK